MPIDRRRLLALPALTALTGAASLPAEAATPTGCAFGVDGALYGLRPGSPDDQSQALQRAINDVARSRKALALAPGVYRVGNINLPAGVTIVGTRGATRLLFTEGPSLMSGKRADNLSLTGLTFDGALRPLPEGRGLLQLDNARSVKIAECTIVNAGGDGMELSAIDGAITATTFTNIMDAAIHSNNARGLLISGNTITGAANNGIEIWRDKPGDDGTIVADNRIEAIDNRAGGSGQYGNAINVFRAKNVIVRGNRISNCAFSAVRGNTASNIMIEGNTVVDVKEVALYAEFAFEGAVIANNMVDGAAIGVSITNFDQGGRLAIVQGNVIRNLLPTRPKGTDPGDGAGIGISVEADTAVTGNVIESAPYAGMVLGFGPYLRDIAATGNVVRLAMLGIAVSVTAGAGVALIANNLIAESKRGAIVGMDRNTIVSGDLTKTGNHFANVTLSGNRVR